MPVDRNVDSERKEAENVNIDFENFLAIANRQWKTVLTCLITSIVLGTLYLLTATPIYTASSSLLIDRGNSQIGQDDSDQKGPLDIDGATLSEVELLKSDSVLGPVIDKLDLLSNTTFLGSGSSLIGRSIGLVRTALSSIGLVGSANALTDDMDVQRQAAVDKLARNLSVTRVGLTYVMNVAYNSPSAKLSEAVSTAVVESYLKDKLEAKYDATRRASVWLLARIEELKKSSLESDLKVQEFRNTNGLMSTNGWLLSDIQLVGMTNAVHDAQQETAKAKARYQSIENILDSGDSESIITGALDNMAINTLREKYLTDSKIEADISTRLGKDHQQAVRLRTEMQQYRRLMFEELGRIAQAYKSDLSVAESRELELNKSLIDATKVSGVAGESQVQLRELERTAETYKTLYQTFLQRYQQANQQESFPINDARIITRATAPVFPSAPKKPLVMALFFFLGLMSGAGVAAFREFRDRYFRTGAQIRRILGLEFLGNASVVPPSPKKATQQPGGPRDIRLSNGIYHQVVNNPLSSLAETLRSAKMAIDFHVPKPCKIIGMVSALPGEGKSTLAVNFAMLLANQGLRTLLIDGDLRNPGSTRALGRHATEGLLEMLLEDRNENDLILTDPRSGLSFMPTVVKRRIPHSAELLGSAKMDQFLSRASAHYDFIVVDLPPLAPVIDARSLASKLDGFIWVVEWGKTSRRMVQQTMMTEPLVAEKCFGVILNKVDSKRLKLYRDHGSSEYYAAGYTSYYQEGA